MYSVRPVPLAWNNLTHDRVRFALYILGICFAVVLIGVQMGIRNALIDSNVRIVDRLRADIVLVHPHRAALFYREGVSRRRLEQARAVQGVQDAHGFYVDYQFGKLMNTAVTTERRPRRTIRMIGVDPHAGLFDIPELMQDTPERNALLLPGTALIDRQSKRVPRNPNVTVYGPIPLSEPAPWQVPTELNRRALTIVGGFDLGTDFGADGTMIVNESTFREWVRKPAYPMSPAATADLGILRVQPGQSVGEVKERLVSELLGKIPRADHDVEILTKQEFRDREVMFWLIMTPIGFAFNAGIILGFVVGSVICYQILSAGVVEHLTEYATLRAMGYTNWYLSWVVLQESIILAIAGYLPGIALTYFLYSILGNLTGLPVDLTPDRAGWILLATIGMCVSSGLLALRKAQTADPANVF